MLWYITYGHQLNFRAIKRPSTVLILLQILLYIMSCFSFHLQMHFYITDVKGKFKNQETYISKKKYEFIYLIWPNLESFIAKTNEYIKVVCSR